MLEVEAVAAVLHPRTTETETNERRAMSDWTYKLVEITGTSKDGVTEAMRSGVARA